jgi:hypothetical protein
LLSLTTAPITREHIVQSSPKVILPPKSVPSGRTFGESILAKRADTKCILPLEADAPRIPSGRTFGESVPSKEEVCSKSVLPPEADAQRIPSLVQTIKSNGTQVVSQQLSSNSSQKISKDETHGESQNDLLTRQHLLSLQRANRGLTSSAAARSVKSTAPPPPQPPPPVVHRPVVVSQPTINHRGGTNAPSQKYTSFGSGSSAYTREASGHFVSTQSNNSHNTHNSHNTTLHTTQKERVLPGDNVNVSMSVNGKSVSVSTPPLHPNIVPTHYRQLQMLAAKHSGKNISLGAFKIRD